MTTCDNKHAACRRQRRGRPSARLYRTAACYGGGQAAPRPRSGARRARLLQRALCRFARRSHCPGRAAARCPIYSSCAIGSRRAALPRLPTSRGPSSTNRRKRSPTQVAVLRQRNAALESRRSRVRSGSRGRSRTRRPNRPYRTCIIGSRSRQYRAATCTRVAAPPLARLLRPSGTVR